MEDKKTMMNALSPTLFWDVDRTTIEYTLHAPYIIERVLNMGTMEDFNIIKSYYGKTKLKQVAMQLRYMDDRLLHFCSVYFKTPLADFRCYTTKQLNHTHWSY